MIIFNGAIKRILKNKLRLILLLIMPILFIIMFATMEERALTIGVVDKDHTTLSMMLTNRLGEIHEVEVMVIEEKTVFDKAVSYKTDYTIIIEDRFEEKLISGQNTEIKEFYLMEKEKIYYVRNFLENYIYNMKTLAMGSGFNKDNYTSALDKFERSNLTVVNGSQSSNKIPQTRSAMGFLIQFMLYMSVITAGIVSEDKNSGVFYRVLYAPVTLKRYFIENLLTFLIVGILQVTLVLSLVRTVFGMKLGGNPMSMYLLFILFSIVCISLGMWLVSIFKKPIGAYITSLLITTPLVMLGGCYWPVNYMPPVLQKIGLFTPTYWIMSGVDKILYECKNINGILLEILVLIIFAGIFLAAGLLKKVDVSK